MLAPAAVEDRAHLALTVVERHRPLKRLLHAQMGEFDLALEPSAGVPAEIRHGIMAGGRIRGVGQRGAVNSSAESAA